MNVFMDALTPERVLASLVGFAFCSLIGVVGFACYVFYDISAMRADRESKMVRSMLVNLTFKDESLSYQQQSDISDCMVRNVDVDKALACSPHFKRYLPLTLAEVETCRFKHMESIRARPALSAEDKRRALARILDSRPSATGWMCS